MRETVKKLKTILSEKERRHMGILSVFMLIGGIMELVGVTGVFVLISVIMNEGVSNISRMMIVGAGLILVYILKMFYLMALYNDIYRFVNKGRSALSVKLFNLYIKEPYESHTQRNLAMIQRVVRADVDGCYAVVRNLLQLTIETVICVILGAFLFWTDFLMALFMSLLLGLCVGVVAVISKRIVKRLGQKEMQYNYFINQWMLNGIGGIKEIKLLNNEDYFVDNFRSNSEQSCECARKQQLLSHLPRLLTETICVIGIVLLIIFEILSGNDMVEMLPKLSVFAVAAFRLLPSVGKINSYLGEYHYYKNRVDSVYDVVNEIESLVEEENKDVDERIEAKPDISIEDVTYKYANTEKYILRDVKLKIPYGKSIGVIGPSGAGKTTFVDIVMGLLSPERGRICAGDKDITCSKKNWHSLIGYVPQTIFLSDDSIKNNIAFGIPKEEIDDERMDYVVKKAQLFGLINELPEGLETRIGDNGVRLSGGQRQRIGIARALYNEPAILVLDEATSALDSDTETAVMEAVENLHGELTMIIIAHRISTIDKCDEVYEVKEQKVTKIR